MGYFKRIFCIITVVLLALAGSSCNIFENSTEDLMAAPDLTGDLKDIQEIMQADAKYQLLFPKTGAGRRSSFLPVQNDAEDEVEVMFAFYSTDNGQKANIGRFRKSGEGWAMESKHTFSLGTIEEAFFDDFTGSGSPQLVTIWSLLGSTDRQINLFSFEEGKFNTLLSEKYSEYLLADFTADDLNDIFIIQRDRDAMTAAAAVFTFINGEKTPLGAAPLDGSVKEYAKLSLCKGLGDSAGVYIDAYKTVSAGSDEMITDIVYFKDKVLKSEFQGDSEKNITQRSQTMVCTDINRDEIPEIPFMSQLPNPRPIYNSADQVNLVRWRQFDGKDFITAMYSVHNTSDSYYVEIPEDWVSRFTIERDTVNRRRIYYEWDEGKKTAGEMLMTLQVFTDTSWESVSKSEWVLLYTKSGLIYAAQLGDSEMAPTQNELRLQMFHIID